MDYIFHCENPRCRKSSPITGPAHDLLNQCRAKEMQMAMAKCPTCDWSQSFNPQEPDGKKRAEPKPQKFSSETVVPELPAEYLAWLERLGRKQTITLDDFEWEIASRQ